MGKWLYYELSFLIAPQFIQAMEGIQMGKILEILSSGLLVLCLRSDAPETVLVEVDEIQAAVVLVHGVPVVVAPQEIVS